jgi:hypothetical protein
MTRIKRVIIVKNYLVKLLIHKAFDEDVQIWGHP